MTSSHNDKVVDSALRLFAALLFQGNKDVQGTFLEYVKNTVDEQFFIEIRDRLQTSMASIKEARLLQAMKESQKEQEKQVHIPTGPASCFITQSPIFSRISCFLQPYEVPEKKVPEVQQKDQWVKAETLAPWRWKKVLL